MYRGKIREHYDRLSRSYRRVADYVMSHYYEVSFMTAADSLSKGIWLIRIMGCIASAFAAENDPKTG